MLALKRRIGFGAGEALEHFVVLQSPRFAASLETTIVAPLDVAAPAYGKFPGAVPVTVHGGTNFGAASVVLVPFLGSLPLARFEPLALGRLDRRDLSAIDRVVRLLLGMV